MLSPREFKPGKQIYVDDYLADLIPGFIKSKMEDLAILNKACHDHDSEIIRKIGHNWKGVCPSYGFHDLGKLGKQFETLAAAEDFHAVQEYLDTLPAYLRGAQIIARPESENAAEFESDF